jgi:hypothetical protein
MFHSAILSPKPSAVTVEYTDRKGARVTKTFPDMHRARSFYLKKDREGAAPKVVKAAV